MDFCCVRATALLAYVILLLCESACLSPCDRVTKNSLPIKYRSFNTVRVLNCPASITRILLLESFSQCPRVSHESSAGWIAPQL